MAKEVGKCPNCGGFVYETAKGFSCANWSDKENPCDFTIWKESYGATFTAEDAKTILSGKNVRKHNTAMNGDRYEVEWFFIKGRNKLSFKKIAPQEANV